jgi:hypothetical protein
LAQELDGIYGGHVLADAVKRIAARNFAVRALAAARYREMLAHSAVPPDAELAQLLTTLRGTLADNDDIFLGVELFVGRPLADTPLYAKVARAQSDPWFDALAAEADISLAHVNDVTRIEPLSRAAIQRCNYAGISFRCLRLTDEFVYWLTESARVNEAEALASDGRKRAWPRDPVAEAKFLDDLAEIEWRRNDSNLMNAYLDEMLARAPDSCDVMRDVHERKALFAFRRLQPQLARRELQAVPEKCQPNRCSFLGAIILTSLLHIDGSDAEYETAESVFQRRRSNPNLSPTRKVELDIYEGRALLERHEPDGEAMIRQAIATADARPAEDGIARRARADGYVTLIAKAAQHGRWPQALSDVAADLHEAPPPPCTLALLVDDVRAVSVWRDRDGNVSGRLGVRRTPEVAPAEIAPDEVVAPLRGCPEVRVLAVPPLHGRADLLPPELAWGYGEGRPSVTPQANPPRRLIITDVRPPESLQLAPLAARSATVQPNELVLRGAAATPERVLAELPDADEAVLDVHGLIDLGQSDASMLVLSPDSLGRYALTANAISKLHLHRAPLVALAACNAAHTAPFLHEAWSLPMTFIGAGARAVLGSSAPIPDRDADRFFDRVLTRIHNGQTPAIALRDEREAWRARGQSWTTNVILFQ